GKVLLKFSRYGPGCDPKGIGTFRAEFNFTYKFIDPACLIMVMIVGGLLYDVIDKDDGYEYPDRETNGVDNRTLFVFENSS
ncbi:MAG: hypothetical protein MI674_06835, partial [Cytophagales bacterium]|nr:hypothetical protein [Cytophagales bacterium]